MKKIIILFLISLIFIGCSTGSSSKKQSESDLFEFCGDSSYTSPNNVVPADAKNQSKNLSENWWKDSAFYHIWVKSFYDSDGDGCGDFKGIEAKLDYINDTLGCDAIWLSPIFECSYKGKTSYDNMHGYDTTDYYSVNDYFGSEDDLISLINACHSRNMKIIFDFVPNHCSSNNQWFKKSAENKDYINWFMWSDKQLNWYSGMNYGNWFNYSSNRYYYGAFGASMPDFNFRNYEVREEMKNIARYWLNKGFDGMRIDAVQYLIENSSLCYNTQETHEWFKELRTELNKYSSPKFMVGETWCDKSTANKYFGNDDEFQMVFDFDQGLPCIQSVSSKSDKTQSTIQGNPSKNRSYGTFLGNHDEYAGRFGTTLHGDRKSINLATALSLLRPTVPFIYYGNELGMPETTAGGDARLRGAFNWTLEAQQENTGNSTLKLNNALIELRKHYPSAFNNATVKKLTVSDNSYIAYILDSDNEDLLCFFNLKNVSVSSMKVSNISGYTNASLIAGDTNAPSCEFAGNAVTIKNVGPLSFRVYVLDKNTSENYFDDEEYNEQYSIKTDKYVSDIPVTSMYLRGTMNGWGGYKMDMKTSPSGEQIFYIRWNSSYAGTIEFKFCVNDSANWGSSWGDGDKNIRYNVEAGVYEIQFNYTRKEYSVTKIN